MTPLSEALTAWQRRGDAAILVTVTRARGSTPRAAGTCMLVSATATAGTIGGGVLEWEAIRQARARLADTGAEPTLLDLPLGPALGQCCGGAVSLRLEPADAIVAAHLAEGERQALSRQPALLLFGAGHVGRALAAALAPLPWRLSWIDNRAAAFPETVPDAVTCRTLAEPVDAVTTAATGTFFLIMTHSHPLDFALARAALGRGDAAYVGMIGSLTKRRRFERLFRDEGGDVTALGRLRCPIGTAPLGATTIRDKSPAVIAALTAAELLITALGHAPPANAGDTAGQARHAVCFPQDVTDRNVTDRNVTGTCSGCAPRDVGPDRTSSPRQPKD
ncbi:MAG: xanthine dehydrogenase accessory protein XdhC [Azospirillaceae bacterium]|nr:xanthine dehydrogenase accessory protein XdhC [Azospirillaceae bacterium]